MQEEFQASISQLDHLQTYWEAYTGTGAGAVILAVVKPIWLKIRKHSALGDNIDRNKTKFEFLGLDGEGSSSNLNLSSLHLEPKDMNDAIAKCFDSEGRQLNKLRNIFRNFYRNNIKNTVDISDLFPMILDLPEDVQAPINEVLKSVYRILIEKNEDFFQDEDVLATVMVIPEIVGDLEKGPKIVGDRGEKRVRGTSSPQSMTAVAVSKQKLIDKTNAWKEIIDEESGARYLDLAAQGDMKTLLKIANEGLGDSVGEETDSELQPQSKGSLKLKNIKHLTRIAVMAQIRIAYEEESAEREAAKLIAKEHPNGEGATRSQREQYNRTLNRSFRILSSDPVDDPLSIAA